MIGLSKQDSANFTYGTEKVTAGTAGLEQKGQYTLVERAGKVAGLGRQISFLFLSQDGTIKEQGTWDDLVELNDLGIPVTNIVTGAVYTFVLETGHTAMISGMECVTLGHGFAEDVVRHPFFGSRQVVEDLRAFPGWAAGMITLQQACFRRSSSTGMIAAIRRPHVHAAASDEVGGSWATMLALAARC
eukprot:gene16125-23790_t